MKSAWASASFWFATNTAFSRFSSESLSTPALLSLAGFCALILRPWRTDDFSQVVVSSASSTVNVGIELQIMTFSNCELISVVQLVCNSCAVSGIASHKWHLEPIFNGLDRHCGAPFVRKRALLLIEWAFAPLSSLRSSIHPRIRLRGFLRAVFQLPVHCCENGSRGTISAAPLLRSTGAAQKAWP